MTSPQDRKTAEAFAQSWNHRKLVKFAVSGGAAAVFNVALLYVFVRWFGVWYLSASVFTFVLSVFAHFALQKLWVFVNRDTERVHLQFLKFGALALVNLSLNTLGLYALVGLLAVNYLLAQACLRVVLAIMNYFSYELFVFVRNAEHGTAS